MVGGSNPPAATIQSMIMIAPVHASFLKARDRMRSPHHLAIFRLSAIFAALLSIAPTFAADLAVVTTGALHHMVLDLVPAFEARTGDKVIVTNDTAGGVRARVERGEVFDVIILTVGGLETLTAKGKIVPGSAAPLAKSSIGLAVKDGAPQPDISTAEAFKSAMLAAPSIAWTDPASGGTTGIYLGKLFERMGIADAVRAKSVLVRGGLSAARILTGEATHALQPVSELLAVTGVTVAGKLPEELQGHTIYGAGIGAAAVHPGGAKAFLADLRGEAGTRSLTAHGMTVP
ncbi:MAG: ABC transporter substrate-binding protein [Acetobacteraceae bacterium]|nr:ABC transporter substrate-binding protein [Acetobacteraceae bacterium]